MREISLKTFSVAMTFLECCPLAIEELMLCLPTNFLSKPRDPSIFVVKRLVGTPLVAIMNDQVCSMHVVVIKALQNVSKLLHDSADTPFMLFCYSQIQTWLKPGLSGVCIYGRLPNLQKQE